MCASGNITSTSTRVCEQIESAVHSAIKLYEERHKLEWCDGNCDPDEIKQAAEMLLAAKDTQVCICLEYVLRYGKSDALEILSPEDVHRTSRIHLIGNATAFRVELREPGSCVNHQDVLIPQLDLLSKGKSALLEAAEQGNAHAMFALSRLFDEGVGEPQDHVEAYFWHYVGMEFCDYDWACEGFVDASADQEVLAAQLPDQLVYENSSLHKRARDWIRAHRVLIPERLGQNVDCFDDELEELEDEEEEMDEDDEA
jgi:hypothetical protein